MMKPYYCVTAKSRLTGEREQVTPPCSMENAEAVCQKTKQVPARKRDYLRPKVEVLPPPKIEFQIG